MIHPKIIESLEQNNVHIHIKSDSWVDHENEKINFMLGKLCEKFV